jgi:hypothetical protein
MPTPTPTATANNSTGVVSQYFPSTSSVPVEIILLLITIALSGLSVYLALGTHRFQVKTGLRESLEQLDDILIGKNTKVRVILHDFEYSPIRNAIPGFSDRSNCVLEFRTHELNNQNIGGAGQPIEIEHFIEGLSIPNIRDIEYVGTIEENPYSMRVRFDSINPAECREASIKIMRKIVDVN